MTKIYINWPEEETILLIHYFHFRNFQVIISKKLYAKNNYIIRYDRVFDSI